MRIFLLLLFISFCSLELAGQGIRGLLTDEKGEPLPYASIYVKEKGTGTSSNKTGRYELRLPPGNYQVTYQFVGYATEIRQVKVGDRFQVIDLALQPRAESLQEVNVTGSAQDPAYTIMRKAIAKAPYHLLQCDSYSAKVYMKGSGEA
ncbi:MAG: carboxypeptidase-like regulatory domain-containing protein [Owenweeksia sp.]|nr:carboxypeptidase-like regulatory domain-containing protein [Owenweeksia sp.]